MKKDILTNYFKVRNRELLATTEPNVYFITFIVSSPVAFKFLNVLVLNIDEKLLAGR